jgi:hypothetical protein
LFISGSWHNKLITALTGHPPKLFQLYILGQTFALLVMSIFNIFFVFVFDFNKKKKRLAVPIITSAGSVP